MRLTADDLAGFGEDAQLIHFIDTAFLMRDVKRVAVAVSGGGDSMALLHAASRWAGATGMPLQAVTLDHGLRSEAAAEARMVGEVSAGLDVTHTVLHWDGASATSNTAAAARDARYRMIAEWARNEGIDGVLLGHTQDDVAETFLMRLSRAAGVDGLALMAPRFERLGIAWSRPFWQQSRADLRHYLRSHGVAWVEDPTNEDMTRDRPRARAALAALAPLGITAETLKEVALSLYSARSALEHYTVEEADRVVREDRGDIILDRHPRPPLPPEIDRRLRIAALRFVGGGSYPPRASGLVDLEMALHQAGRHTLGGCLVIQDDMAIRVTREHNAVKDVVCPTTEIWDNRWHLDGPHAPDLEIRALGEAVKDCPDWRETGLPRASLLASPAIWRGETLIAAPLAGYNPDWDARIVTSFASFLLSH